LETVTMTMMMFKMEAMFQPTYWIRQQRHHKRKSTSSDALLYTPNSHKQ
jgi:hypothetical protein